MIQKAEWVVLREIKDFLKMNNDGEDGDHTLALEAANRGDWNKALELLRGYVNTGEMVIPGVVAHATPDEQELEDIAVDLFCLLNQYKAWIRLLEERKARLPAG